MQSKPSHTAEGDKIDVMYIKNMLGKMVWISPVLSKAKSHAGAYFCLITGCTWWIMQMDGETQSLPKRDLIFE